MPNHNSIVFKGTLTIAANSYTGFLSIPQFAFSPNEVALYAVHVKNLHVSQTISEIYFQNVIPHVSGDTDSTIAKLTNLAIATPGADVAVNAGVITGWVIEGFPMGSGHKIGFKRSASAGTMDIDVEIRRV